MKAAGCRPALLSLAWLFVQAPQTTVPSPAPHKPLQCRTFALEGSNKDLNQILSQCCICLEASALAARLLERRKKSFLTKTTTTSGLSHLMVECCERARPSIYPRQPPPKSKSMRRRTFQELKTSMNLYQRWRSSAIDGRGRKSRTRLCTHQGDTKEILPPRTSQGLDFSRKAYSLCNDPSNNTTWACTNQICLWRACGAVTATAPGTGQWQEIQVLEYEVLPCQLLGLHR